MKEGSYTIGQLAATAAVPTSTIRYYERNRLLPPESRAGSNYRLYGPASLERLCFIRAAQANGFALKDIALLLSFRDGRMAPCREVQDLIERRLTDLAERLRQIREVEVILHSSLRACRRAEPSGRCQVIDKLKVASSRTSVGARRPSRRQKKR